MCDSPREESSRPRRTTTPAGGAVVSMRRAALLLLVAATLAAGGCFGPRRNDPAKRAVAAVGVDLALGDMAALESGTGRLWLRLMPPSGQAREAELEWTIRADESVAAAPLGAAPRPRAARLEPHRTGLPAGL